ncbi:MAG: VPLPA-CTERM-specific exosortase XrtD [Xanthobacteraceae bacterium]
MSILSARLPPVSASRSNVLIGVLVGLAVLVSLIAFHGPLLELVRRWSKQEEYSHGFLIPVVVAWLLWSRRDALRNSIGHPSWTGLVLIVLAATMNVIGQLSAIFILSQVGFVVALAGIVLAVGGYSLLRVTLFPIVFLLFAIPLPYFVDSVLTLQLQLVSSELGVFMIQLFQIPVYLDGNIIDLGTSRLLVAEACSGLRYLYPLLCLSFLAAYLFQAPIWQRVIVFLSAIPITIAMNGFRIGLVGILVSKWGAEQAEGLLHLFEGWVIFIACALLLTAEIFLFARLSGKRLFDVFHAPVLKKPLKPQSAPTGYLSILVCLTTLVATGVATAWVSDRPETVPERSRFAAFPLALGPWQGRPSMLEPDIERGLKLDDYIMSDYSAADRRPVNLYVAYYGSQRQGESPHSPIVCIPGGGWQINHFKRINPTAGQPVPFNRVIVVKDSHELVVYYWFDERGRAVANEWWSKWYLFSDAILKNRTDGALVRLTTEVFRGESEGDADRRLQSFMREIVPALKAYLPPETAPAVRSASYRP